MNMTTRKTRACTLHTLDEDLKAAYALMEPNTGWMILKPIF